MVSPPASSIRGRTSWPAPVGRVGDEAGDSRRRPADHLVLRRRRQEALLAGDAAACGEFARGHAPRQGGHRVPAGGACDAENIGLAGRTIGQLKIGEKTDAIVLAFRTAGLIRCPHPTTAFTPATRSSCSVAGTRPHSWSSSYAGRRPLRSKLSWLPMATTPMDPWDGRSPCRRDRCSCVRSGPLSPSASWGSTDRA